MPTMIVKAAAGDEPEVMVISNPDGATLKLQATPDGGQVVSMIGPDGDFVVAQVVLGPAVIKALRIYLEPPD